MGEFLQNQGSSMYLGMYDIPYCREPLQGRPTLGTPPGVAISVNELPDLCRCNHRSEEAFSKMVAMSLS